MEPGNFSNFQYCDNKMNMYLEDAWNAFQTLKETKGLDVFKYLSENDINYKDLIWVDIIDAMKIGHNDAILSVVMRDMQSIAKLGWSTYALCQKKKEDPAMKAAADIARSLLESDSLKSLWPMVHGVKYDDKCPHGLPFYACMSCSH